LPREANNERPEALETARLRAEGKIVEIW